MSLKLWLIYAYKISHLFMDKMMSTLVQIAEFCVMLDFTLPFLGVKNNIFIDQYLTTVLKPYYFLNVFNMFPKSTIHCTDSEK